MIALFKQYLQQWLAQSNRDKTIQEKKEESGSEEMQGEYISGAPERSRTSNRLIRSQILYPVELRVLLCSVYGIRTRDLRLERAMSWATRRTRQVLLLVTTCGPCRT